MVIVWSQEAQADKGGVRIAALTEDSYKYLLWDHRPLTDFWQIGNGKAGRLERNHMYTMDDIAQRTQWDEEWFYKTFGIDAEILIDHAWGIEPVTMYDIKHYKTDSFSINKEPTAELSKIHDRMPLILPKDIIDEWISPESNPDEIVPFALSDMVMEKAEG